ncbi:MAG: ELWxxDGT repeat protein [Pirellulales bacterium]
MQHLLQSVGRRQHAGKVYFFLPRLEPLERRDLLASEPVLVADINRLPDSSAPDELVDVDGTLFFTAQDGASGWKLWKSDGTEAGTVPVKEFIADEEFRPRSLTNVGGTLFFVDGGGDQPRLWTSDGTAQGTDLVRTIYGYTSEFTAANSYLFYTARDDGTSLWRSDGTPEGTFQIRPRNPDNDYDYSDNASDLTNVNGTLFFTAKNCGACRKNLYRTDGAPGHPIRVAFLSTVDSLGNYSPAYGFTAVGASLFFVQGGRLWKSNGTDAGTVIVKDFQLGDTGSLGNFTNFDGTLLFTKYDSASGYELWKSDGTEAGTIPVRNLPANPFELTNVNGTLFFGAIGANGDELWMSNGTEAGTIRVEEMEAGAESSLYQLTNVNGTLFFTVSSGATGEELWKSDGTEAGTMLVHDIHPGAISSYPNYLTGSNGMLFFSADDGMTGRELWKTNGTQTGAERVIDIRSGTSASALHSLTNVDGTLLFAADDGASGDELWRSDGSEAGTTLVTDIEPGMYGSRPDDFNHVNGKLFFTANGELWTSDGSEAGTIRLTDNEQAVYCWCPEDFTTVGDQLFFSAVNSMISRRELWKSDGTSTGTTRVKEIWPFNFIDVDGTLFFSGYDGVDDGALWKSDGTEAGTVPVSEITPNPGTLTNVNGTLFFGDYGAHGQELWKSDGTDDGTVLVKELASGILLNPTNVDGTLVFGTYRGSDPELWKSDGTEAGTVLVKELQSIGVVVSVFGNFTNVNGTLFFVANEGASGAKLWKSDGTDAGTLLVKQFDSGLSNFTNVNGTLFFTANDGANGQELWKSDGTTSGTSLVMDIRSGMSGSFPDYLTNVDGDLYFSADDGIHGNELWVLRPPPGDFDKNHFVNARDIDSLFAAIGAGTNNPAYDLTGDSLVNHDDLMHLVENILSTRIGDANLDRHVNRQDVAILGRSFGRTGTPSWSDGNFDGDAHVGLVDLLHLKQNFEPPVAPSPASPASPTISARARRAKPLVAAADAPLRTAASARDHTTDGAPARRSLRAVRSVANTLASTPPEPLVATTARATRKVF